jgi:hypothetical protein
VITRRRLAAAVAVFAVLCAAGCQSRQPTEEEKADQSATPDASAPAPGGTSADEPAGGSERLAASALSPVARTRREYTVPAGTRIPVRTTTTLSTDRAMEGAPFTGVLEHDLAVDGTVLAREGANVSGVVVTSDPGGRVKGVATLAVGITSIVSAEGDPIQVRTRAHTAVAPKSTGRDVKRGAIMTGAGAAVGAIAGGGKGAAVGAGVGAAAGVGTAMATRGKPAVIPAETLIQFTLRAPVTVVR